MIRDANLNPSQKITYLRNYTKGKAQDLVDNFRKRQSNDPASTLNELWNELERRFGNNVILTNALLEKLKETAKFNSRDKSKLQVFADVCCDVDNQMAHLSGLYCLNYPTAIKPVVDNLPSFLRFKWEKQVVKYAEENNDQYPFHVDPAHRDLLRFLWFKDNDPSQEIVEYRMTVHLFGNSPSPAVATFGMRKTADDGGEAYGIDVKKFICKDFYVDDGLTSQPSDGDAINLVKGAQAVLATSNLRLHKVASNSTTVMEAFSAEDRAKDVRDLDLRQDTLPAQRTLGVQWNLQKDTLRFSVSSPDRPFTRRGVLSVVNSIYDPLGFAAPVVLVGKLLLQQLVLMGKKKQNDKPLGWDDSLPDDLKLRWQCWKDEFPALENVSASRCYHPMNFGPVIRNEIHAFADASKDAIGTSVYLKQVNERGEISVALVFGQSKVAPSQPTSIPRLELSAAVLATQAVKKTRKELDIEIHNVSFYSDSKVVLGYIKNDVRRFHVYVANRVQMIRDVSEPKQWRYIDTSLNPADLATRGVTVKTLVDSDWLNGPSFLRQNSPPMMPDVEHNMDIDENDPEVCSTVNVCATDAAPAHGLGSKRFERFSEWSSLRRTMAHLILKARQRKTEFNSRATYESQEKDENGNPDVPPLDATSQATALIIRTVQNEVFASEISVLAKKDRGVASRYGSEERC